MVSEMVDFAGKGLVATDMEDILYIMLARIRKLSEYRTAKKSKFGNKLKMTLGKKWSKQTGKLVIIKPFKFESIEDMEDFIDKSRDMYFVPATNV